MFIMEGNACALLSVGNTRMDFISNWQRIGASDTIIKWLSYGVTIPLQCIPEKFECSNRRMSANESDFLDSEIRRLLSFGYITECDYERPMCISPISCVPKKGSTSKFRLVTDFRRLNSCCSKVGYKNEDIRTVAELVQAEDYMISVDLKDGFFHIPVCESDTKYLGFRWRNVYYKWLVLPFGLGCSPFYFSKVIRAVITYLRSLGLSVTVFVDDFFLCARINLITDHMDLLVHTLQDLGLNINWDKSVLVPSQSLSHIGYNVSSVSASGRPVIRVEARRIQSLRHDICRVLKKGHVVARYLARITGKCISMAWAVSPGKLLLRATYRLLSERSSWESVLQLTDSVKSELRWWTDIAHLWNAYEVHPRIPDVQIVTDASHIGYGAVLLGSEGTTVCGEWNKRISVKSSNFRELLAIQLAIQALKDKLRGRNIELFSDNVTAIAYINYKGGTSPELTAIATSIWAEILEIGASLVCRHVSGDRNIADKWSRTPDKSDWMLHPAVFHFIDQTFGPHTIDRFANLKSSQCRRFNSRYAEPMSCGIDALAQSDWAIENNFANPPFCLLNRVLDVIVQQKAYATVIAPLWIGQPWFQKLKRISICHPIQLPNSRSTFAHVGNTVPEPRRNPKWKIFAWRVYGGTV